MSPAPSRQEPPQPSRHTTISKNKAEWKTTPLCCKVSKDIFLAYCYTFVYNKQELSFIKGDISLESTQTEAKAQKTNKKKTLTIIGAILGGVVVIALLVLIFFSHIKVFFLVQKLKWAEVGDTFTFGTYEQDGKKTNGAETVEWIVLAKEDNKVLALSKYALDCMPYNSEFESSSWETCTLRSWLNEDFYNSAFNNPEKKVIDITTVTADKNPTFSTDPGQDTQDPMFLLSVSEAEKYCTDRSMMMCLPTKYAQYGRVEVNPDTGFCKWWLRSPGLNPSDATAVGGRGFIYGQGNYVFFQFYGVRPAMWIDLA